MEIAINPIWSLLLIVIGLQFFLDLAFFFLCYLTGVVIFKLFTLFKTDHRFLKYSLFKAEFKINSRYKTATALGFLIWVSAIGLFFVVFS